MGYVHPDTAAQVAAQYPEQKTVALSGNGSLNVAVLRRSVSIDTFRNLSELIAVSEVLPATARGQRKTTLQIGDVLYYEQTAVDSFMCGISCLMLDTGELRNVPFDVACEELTKMYLGTCNAKQDYLQRIGSSQNPALFEIVQAYACVRRNTMFYALGLHAGLCGSFRSFDRALFVGGLEISAFDFGVADAFDSARSWGVTLDASDPRLVPTN